MGHIVDYTFLKATDKDRAMREGYALAEEFAYYNGDREEGSDNYHGNFKFYDKTFNTEDDAIDFFDSLGSYCDGVCMVKEATKGAKTKYAKICDKVQKKKRELRDKALEKFKERTSATVGCKNCGTRITSEEAIRRNLVCPNCRNWLVPDSYKEKLKKLDESLDVAEKQLANDTAESGKPRYWAKFEIHY